MNVQGTAAACSGCGLCAKVCRQGAIQMVQQADGFLYPQIDRNACTNCGACRAVCPFTKSNEDGSATLEAYALKHRDEVRQVSSSGGFFTLLSDSVLDQGGVVYGAVWSQDYSVLHIRADNRVDRDRMRGSKYMQSDISGVLDSIKKDIASGLPVLFTGTPCQCAAVARMFGKKRPENLLMMDVICHGVLPQSLFSAYLADIGKRFPDKRMTSVNLRDKKYGLQVVGIHFHDGTDYHSDQDYFYKVYGMHALQRQSCFACTCAAEGRFGDFTVGDFWGIQHSHPELSDDLGISLVLVNTEKARKLYPALTEQLVSVAVEPEAYLPYQPNLRRPTMRGKRADAFSAYYTKHGYQKTMHRFFDVTLMRRINAIGYKLLKKILRK